MNTINLCCRLWVMVLYWMITVGLWRLFMEYWRVLTVISVLYFWQVWPSLHKSVCSVIWISWMILAWILLMLHCVGLQRKNLAQLLFLNWSDRRQSMIWLQKRLWKWWHDDMMVIIFIRKVRVCLIRSVCSTHFQNRSLVVTGFRPEHLLSLSSCSKRVIMTCAL